MPVTLQPTFDALGYSEPKQQRALVKLLQAAGAFGDVKGVSGMLTDQQADAILQHVTFNSHEQAAKLLHEITQEKLIKHGNWHDRHGSQLNKLNQKENAELMQAVRDAGLMDAMKPTRKHYDHVLLLGATEGETEARFETMKHLWDQGVRFDKVHMLGSERPLNSESEHSANAIGPNGNAVSNEMDMMELHYYDKQARWPEGLEKVRIFEVNTYNKPGGERANTQDTVKSWLKTHPDHGEVLVISSQPYARYQDAAVKAVLPSGFHVETVSDAAHENVSISSVLDRFAREVDVAMPKVLERLQMKPSRLKTQLALFDPKDIQVDAATYQFRSGGDAKGVTNKGRFHADHWDPVLHGDPIMVHERLDGRVFVADGHHRHSLATELNEKGVGPGKIAAMVLKESDGYSATDVKIIAAYKNIAHGKCDPVDTARVFKEAYGGKVNVDALPHLQMDKGNLRMAFTMSKLSENALSTVARGEVPVPIAVKLAEAVPDDQNKQDQVIKIISDKLKQDYKVAEPVKPASLQFNVFNFPKDLDVKAVPGFVEKLAAQRAAASVNVFNTRA